MITRYVKPTRPLVSLCLCLGMLSGGSAAQLLLAARAVSQAPTSQPPPPAASGDIQKLRDEIQLKAMGEVADKISLVASDMYAEANKGNPKASNLNHPQTQATKLVPGGVTGSTDISWSSDAKPSNDWLGVFVSELDSWFPLFKEEMSSLLIPDDKESVVGQDWSELQSDLKAADDEHQQLISLSKTDPPDGPKIARICSDLYYKMQAIKSLTEDMYQILGATNTAQESMPASWKHVGESSDPAGNSGASQTTSNLQATSNTAASNQANQNLSGHVHKSSVALKDLHEATVKMERTSRDMIGELERWNLLWGQPPADNSKSGMLWGGGLSKEEVLSEYKNLPLTVFTMPNYVKFFSYRLPPRKKYLLVYTRQLGQQINMLAKALNGETEPASPEWSQIQDLSKDVAARYINLLNLIENTDDDRLKKSIRADQLTFGEPMAAIYQDVEKMGALVKQINEDNKKPSKSSGKAT